jgi:uncharacterized membrane protein YciS (DUF1049 family)
MGTFTLETGLGMLAFGVAVTITMAIIGLIVIRSQAQQTKVTNSRSDIEKQIDRLKEVN